MAGSTTAQDEAVNRGTVPACGYIQVPLPGKWLVKWLWLLAVVLATTSPATSQDHQSDQQTKHILILETMYLPIIQEVGETYQTRLAEMGAKNGYDVAFTVLNADGDLEKGLELLRDHLRNHNPDLIYSIATLATRAVRMESSLQNVPHVFGMVADPVKEGLTTAIGKASGANVTGRSFVPSGRNKLGLLEQVVGRERQWKIGLLHSSYPSASSTAKRLMRAQENFAQFSFIPLVIDYQSGDAGRQAMLSDAATAITDHAATMDGLWLPPGPLSASGVVVSHLSTLGLPILMASNSHGAQNGAMLAVITSPEENALADARLSHQVLQGNNAGDIPITRPDVFQIQLNSVTATQAGVTIPPHIQRLAGDHIYP